MKKYELINLFIYLSSRCFTMVVLKKKRVSTVERQCSELSS